MSNDGIKMSYIYYYKSSSQDIKTMEFPDLHKILPS